MGILNRLLAWVEQTARSWRGVDTSTPDARPGRGRRPVGPYVMSTGLMGGGTTMGWPGGWTQDRIELVLHFRHWTFISVRAICQEIAGLSPRVAVVRSGASRTERHFHATSNRFQKSLRAVQDNEQITDVGSDHPLCRLFQKPNAWDVAADLWYELIMFLELTGNGYLWVVPNRAGLPQELWVIPSHWVWPRLGPAGIKFYEVRPFIGPGTLHFPPEEIIHLRWKSPIHKIDGWSAQQAGSEWIDAAESVDRSRFYQFKNGCFPIGNLELGEQYNDPDDQDLERIYAKFFARIQGEQNYGRPIITPPGAKYTPLTISPAEMAYVQSADQLRDWTLALFGVPKEIAGIQDAGSEIAMYGPLVQFTQRTIAPKLRYLGQVLTRFLADRYDPFTPDLRVWWDDPAPTSPDQINRDLDLDARYGQITSEEYRAVRGRRPYTDAEMARYNQIGKSASAAPPGRAPGSPGMRVQGHANGRIS